MKKENVDRSEPANSEHTFTEFHLELNAVQELIELCKASDVSALRTDNETRQSILSKVDVDIAIQVLNHIKSGLELETNWCEDKRLSWRNQRRRFKLGASWRTYQQFLGFYSGLGEAIQNDVRVFTLFVRCCFGAGVINLEWEDRNNFDSIFCLAEKANFAKLFFDLVLEHKSDLLALFTEEQLQRFTSSSLVWREAISRKVEVYRFAPAPLRRERDILINVIDQWPEGLVYADESLRGQSKLALRALRNVETLQLWESSKKIFSCLPVDIQSNTAVVNAYLQANKNAYRPSPPPWSNKEVRLKFFSDIDFLKRCLSDGCSHRELPIPSELSKPLVDSLLHGLLSKSGDGDNTLMELFCEDYPLIRRLPFVGSELRDLYLSNVDLVCQFVSVQPQIYVGLSGVEGPSPLSVEMRTHPRVVATLFNFWQYSGWSLSEIVPKSFFDDGQKISDFLLLKWQLDWRVNESLWDKIPEQSLDDYTLALRVLEYNPDLYHKFTFRIQRDKTVLKYVLNRRKNGGLLFNEQLEILFPVNGVYDDVSLLKDLVLEFGYVDAGILERIELKPDDVKRLLAAIAKDDEALLLKAGTFREPEMCKELIDWIQHEVLRGSYSSERDVRFAKSSLSRVVKDLGHADDDEINRALENLTVVIESCFSELRRDSFEEFSQFFLARRLRLKWEVLPEKWRDDRLKVLSLIKIHPLGIQLASCKLVRQLNFLEECVTVSPQILYHLSEQHKQCLHEDFEWRLGVLTRLSDAQIPNWIMGKSRSAEMNTRWYSDIRVIKCLVDLNPTQALTLANQSKMTHALILRAIKNAGKVPEDHIISSSFFRSKAWLDYQSMRARDTATFIMSVRKKWSEIPKFILTTPEFTETYMTRRFWD